MKSSTTDQTSSIWRLCSLKSGNANSSTADVLALLLTDTPDSDFVNSKPWVVWNKMAETCHGVGPVGRHSSWRDWDTKFRVARVNCEVIIIPCYANFTRLTEISVGWDHQSQNTFFFLEEAVRRDRTDRWERLGENSLQRGMSPLSETNDDSDSVNNQQALLPALIKKCSH